MSSNILNANDGQLEKQPAASVACTPCARKKRKCDRKRPSCSRCFQNRQPCHYYDSLYPTPINGASVSGTPYLAAPTREMAVTIDVLRTLSNQSTTPAQLIAKYNGIIRPWLPIFSVRRMKDGLDPQRMLETADVEAACLLLCIHINTQPSSTRNQNYARLQESYIQARNIFASSQMLNKSSVGTAQCGLLLTVYQIGTGMFSDAYITLSTTTALARANRLHENCQMTEEEQTVAHAVWWAIFLLDRLLALASIPNNLPLLVEQPHSFADLKAKLAFGVCPHSTNEERVQILENFCGEIEAAYLAGQSIYYLNNQNEHRDSIFDETNKHLREILSILFDRASGWRPLCGSIAIVLVAATELQFARLAELNDDKEALDFCLHTLSTFIGITIEIAEHYIADQNQKPNHDVAPLASVIGNYRSLLAIKRQNALGHAMTAEHNKGLDVLREALQLNSSWWALADKYTDALTLSTP